MWKNSKRGFRKYSCEGSYRFRTARTARTGRRRELRLTDLNTGLVWEYPSWQAARAAGWLLQ